MEDIRSKDYAEFMENALKGMMDFDVEGICIITKAKGDLMYTCYHNSSVMDKIAYAGLIQQDAMMDTLKANKLIKEKPDFPED